MADTVTILADAHYRQQQQVSLAATQAAQTMYKAMPTDLSPAALMDWWQGPDGVLYPMTETVLTAQVLSASTANQYIAAQTAVQGASGAARAVAPMAFTSNAGDLADWLTTAFTRGLLLEAGGMARNEARMSGLSKLTQMVTTLVSDAGREAVGAGIVGHPSLTGYFRRLRLPSCSRCAVMAGKHYKWNAGFERHPRCDCIHVPSTRSYEGTGFDVTDAVASGEVTGLTEAQRVAILDYNADPSQVINANQSGARYTGMFDGRKVELTRQGATNRALGGKRLLFAAGQRKGVAERLSPGAIYKLGAGNRAKTSDLLFAHGYLV